MAGDASPTYHLWLKPKGRAYDVLARAIRTLASELDVEPFEPHATLLAYLDGTEQDHRRRAAELGGRLPPCECILTKAAYLNEHFRCLFMLVEPTPAIMTCHSTAATVFGKRDEPYMPHVSLVYGSLAESRKKEIIQALSPDVRTSFIATSVILLRSESMQPKDWHEVAEFPFRGQSGIRS
jgi:2'-5' RNA ligase